MAAVGTLPIPVQAVDFTMRTGHYVGTGATNTISGLGFQPQLVIVKSSTAAGVAVFKSSAMPANATAFFSATADNTATSITLTSDGFTLGSLANVNSTNVLYRWIAFKDSDCTSTGYLCVGTYTGNGTSPRAITTGFQPQMVVVKRSTAVAAHFQTATMGAARTEFFTSTAADTTSAYIAGFSTTAFSVGATDNVTGGVYYYLAFRGGNGKFSQGQYTGNAVDNTNISGLGFRPDFVLIKNSTNATTNNRRSVMSMDKHFGDHASYVGDAVADAVNMIQGMQTDGFQIGSGGNTNGSTSIHYWFAFGGGLAMPAGTGTFTMAGQLHGRRHSTICHRDRFSTRSSDYQRQLHQLRGLSYSADARGCDGILC